MDNLTNTIQVYKGRKRNGYTLKDYFKKDVTYVDGTFIYNRDLKGLATSELEVIGINLGIDKGDVIYFDNKVAVIREIQELDQLTTKLVLNFNSDCVIHQVYGITEYSTFNDYAPETYAPIKIQSTGAYILVFQDTTQYIDSIMRRIMLSTQVIEEVSIASSYLFVNLVRDERPPLKIRLDDTSFKVVTENYSQSGSNYLILVSKEHYNTKEYTVDLDGNVYVATGNDEFNIQVSYLEVDTDLELEDIAIAQSFFSSNNEAFEIVIDVPSDYMSEDLNLSREIDLYLRDERMIHTKITKISETNEKREITLGLSRSSYFDVVRKDVK